jgi:hypothetical protein
MVGILLTLLAVILVICLAFCYSGKNTIVHQHADQLLWHRSRKTARKKN